MTGSARALTAPSGVADPDFKAEVIAHSRAAAGLSRRGFLAALGLGAATMPAHAQRPGGSIRIGYAEEVPTLDPQLARTGVQVDMLYQIFDPLLHRDDDGSIKPALAEQWDFENGGRRLILKLRQDVVFHDGTRFDAEAVRFTIMRHLAPETQAPTRYLWAPVTGVEILDPFTVAVSFSAPFATVWVALCHAYCGMVSPTAARVGPSFGRRPVGTGAFKLDRWSREGGIRMARNPDHKLRAPNGRNTGAAYLDSIEYVLLPEDATRMAALRSGEVDMLATNNSVPFDRIGALQQSGFNLVRHIGLSVSGFQFNQKIAPTNDVRVRRALVHAVDRDKVNMLVTNGTGKVAYSLLASGFPDYRKDLEASAYPFDPDRARALLREAGIPRGQELSVVCVNTYDFRAMTEIMQADFAAVGIALKPQLVPFNDAMAISRRGETHMAQFLYYGWTDPDIVRIFTSNLGTSARHFAEQPELERLFAESLVTVDPEARRALIGQVQETILRQAYHLPMIQFPYLAAVRRGLQGVSIASSGYLFAKEISLGG